jgi:hypothetical protein
MEREWGEILRCDKERRMERKDALSVSHSRLDVLLKI